MTDRAAPVGDGDPYERRRRAMVQRHVAGRGITDRRVVAAMKRVRRDRFVAPAMAEFAYEDRPLPIDAEQTISQPYIVAVMAAAAEIEPKDRVLEIGTGSGYGAAVLGCLAEEVWTVERHHVLVVKARIRLAAEGFSNVHVVEGDGSLGWPDAAPFDAIVVTANAPSVPPALCDQLADGGRLVLPIGPQRASQELARIRRSGDRITTEDLGSVRFVPLVGEEGWPLDPLLIAESP